MLPFFWASVWQCWSDYPKSRNELSLSVGAVVLSVRVLVLFRLYVATAVFVP